MCVYWGFPIENIWGFPLRTFRCTDFSLFFNIFLSLSFLILSMKLRNRSLALFNVRVLQFQFNFPTFCLGLEFTFGLCVVMLWAMECTAV